MACIWRRGSRACCPMSEPRIRDASSGSEIKGRNTDFTRRIFDSSGTFTLESVTIHCNCNPLPRTRVYRITRLDAFNGVWQLAGMVLMAISFPSPIPIYRLLSQ